jgi:O-antigen ligase
VPWGGFLFLWGVFFLAEPLDLTFSTHSMLNLEESTLTTEDRVEQNIEHNQEGSRRRQLGLIALACLGIWNIVKVSSPPVRPRGLLGVTVLFFLAWCGASLAWSDAPLVTMRKLVVLACLCVGALGVARSLSLRQVVHLTLFGTSLVLILGIVFELLLGTFRPLRPGYRFSGLTWPAFTAWSMCLLVLAVLALRHKSDTRSARADAPVPSWHTRSLIPLAGCALLMLLLTKTRASLGALMAAFLVYGWMTWPARHKILAGALSCMVIALAGLMVEVSGHNLEGVFFNTTNLGRAESAEGVSGRAELWEDLFPYIRARPLTGYGYDTFWTPSRLSEVGESHWGAPDAHNGFINLTLGIGLVGTGVYLFILIMAVKRAWCSYRVTANADYVFVCGTVVLVVVQILFVSTQLAPAFYSFVTLLVVARLGFIEEPATEDPGGVAV